ncbi:hypothetical protein CAL7716_102540 (plasmid) [Calothrix sp. PCC 7716]|nr:hypothetical protein CAL7716_102540 [Calothrix sp. PCC 7716]
MTQQIPRYIEGINPGFEELDISKTSVPDTPEQEQLRKSLTIKIYAEYDRLRLDLPDQEYLQDQHKVQNLEEAPLAPLKLYLCWLESLIRKNLEEESPD